ncbi:MAG: hypothetical protein AAGB12_10520 [Pseudomonadota bacterium]
MTLPMSLHHQPMPSVWHNKYRNQATHQAYQQLWQQVQKYATLQAKLKFLSKKVRYYHTQLNGLNNNQQEERLPMESAITAIYGIVVNLYAETAPYNNANRRDYFNLGTKTTYNNVIALYH